MRYVAWVTEKKFETTKEELFQLLSFFREGVTKREIESYMEVGLSGEKFRVCSFFAIDEVLKALRYGNIEIGNDEKPVKEYDIKRIDDKFLVTVLLDS